MHKCKQCGTGRGAEAHNDADAKGAHNFVPTKVRVEREKRTRKAQLRLDGRRRGFVEMIKVNGAGGAYHNPGSLTK